MNKLNPFFRSARSGNEVWGIVGGMGPRASSAFLETIYASTGDISEQAAPRIVLLSDPTFPDRTECLLSGRNDLLIEPLDWSLSCLWMWGATHAVVCCMTMHAVFPYLPEQAGILVSLTDTMLSQVVEGALPSLFLCTNGARKCRLFESHPLWSAAQKYVLFPDDQDQILVHDLIYDLKRGVSTPQQEQLLLHFRKKYGAYSLGAGCTEFHLLSRSMAKSETGAEVPWIDPLRDLAARIVEGVSMNTQAVSNQSYL
jgi:aspartate racemase